MKTTNKNVISFENIEFNRDERFRPKNSLKKPSFKPLKSLVCSRSLRPHKGLVFSNEKRQSETRDSSL